LTVERIPVQTPKSLNQVVFNRQFLDDEGVEVVHQTSFEMYLTDEEVTKLKEAL
jgi:maleate cis-trans isomerase